MRSTKQFDTRPPLALIREFEEAFHNKPDFVIRAPGRIDLLGTHTDYNEGFVLPAAINRYVWMAVREIPMTVVSLRIMQSRDNRFTDQDEVIFRLTELESRRSLVGEPLPNWASYAAGVAWSLQESGLATPGSQIVISSDVPIGAGLSSSAAVEVAYISAWAYITGWEVEKMELAQICQRAENEFVGVQSGLMDQFSSLFGKKGAALLFDCRTHAWQAVPLPPSVTLVVADTRSRRTLANSAYNQRRQECDRAVDILHRYQPNIRALRDVTVDMFEAHADLLDEPARSRSRHVIYENERVQAAARALKANEPAVLGELMDESYISSRDLFDASGPELEAMWQASQGHPARLGGRFVGAGWAGCMVFLVSTDGADDFMAYLRSRYMEASGVDPLVYTLKPAEGASVISLRGL